MPHKVDNPLYTITGRISFFIFLIALGLMTFHPAMSQGSQGIAAIVNNDVISRLDIDSRLRFIIFSSRLPGNQIKNQRLRSQVITKLINERLQLQEANRRQIKVSPRQIEAAIYSVEKRNKLRKGSLTQRLKKHGIDIIAYEQRLEAAIAWRQIIVQDISKSGGITSDAIDEQIKLIRANKGKPEYLVAEIFIPFDASSTNAEVAKIAMRIRNQIIGGARFSGLARSLSQSASASRGGSLGWIREDQLDPELAVVVRKMKRSELSNPIKALDGYYLLQLRNKRIAKGLIEGKIIVTLQQMVLPLARESAPSEVQNQLQLARSLSTAALNCRDLATLGREMGLSRSGRIEDVKTSSLAPNLRRLAENLEIGKASDPIKTKSGVLVIMVCKREVNKDKESMRQKIAMFLSDQKAELLSKRLLRDLRQSAFVDVR